MNVNSADVPRPGRNRARVALTLLAAIAGVAWWWNASQLPNWRKRSTLHGDTRSIAALAFSPDGRTLVESTWTDDEPIIRLWDVSRGVPKTELHSRDNDPVYVHYFAFSPDGKYLAAAFGAWNGMARHAEIWEMASNKNVQYLEFDPYLEGGDAIKASFSANGQLFQIAAQEGEGTESSQFYSWDTATWRRVETFSAMSEPGMATPAFARDGRSFGIATEGGLLKLCESHSGRERARLKLTDPRVAFAHDYQTGHEEPRFEFSPRGDAVALTSRHSSWPSPADVIWDIQAGRITTALSGRPCTSCRQAEQPIGGGLDFLLRDPGT